MVAVQIFSISIFVFLLLVIIVSFGMIPIFRLKTQSIFDSKTLFIFLIVLAILFSLAFIIIFLSVKPENFIRPARRLPDFITIPTVPPRNIPTTPPRGINAPGPIPEPPTFPPTTQPPNYGGRTQFTSYYQYNPRDRTLNKLSLERITGGKNIIDYFHRNDESIFVLDDGTVVSILGDDIQTYRTSPPIQKIRVLGNQYVGLSNGKLYLSSDLRNWTEDRTKPSNIIEFDVPAAQTNILYIRSVDGNFLYDINTNQIVSRETPGEPKRYGSVLDSYVKYVSDGIVHNRGTQETKYTGFIIGDVDNKDTLYIFPVKISDEYSINEIYTADDNVILKVFSFENPPDRIPIPNETVIR